MNSPLCLDWLQPRMRWERRDELWFDPFHYSGVWACPPWSYQLLYRTPGGQVVPHPGLHVVRPLRMLVDEANAHYHLEAALELKPDGVDLPWMTDEWVAALATAAPRWLRLGMATELSDDGWRVLSEISSLTHVVINRPIDNTVMAHLSRLPGLKTLFVTGYELTDPSLSTLPPLDVLGLEGTGVTDAGLQFLSHWPLRLLSLSVGQINGSGLVHLPTTLRDLDLGANYLDAGSLVHLSRLTQLEHLNLGSIESGSGIEQVLAGLSKLRSVGLSRCHHVDIAALPRLQRLSLNGGGGLPADLSALAGLQELTLSDATIDDAQVATLRGSTTLQALDLKTTSVSGTGLSDGFSHLSRLNLFNNLALTEAGLEAVASLPALEQLNLGSCAFVYESEQSCGLTDRMVSSLERTTTLKRVDLSANFLKGPTFDRLRGARPGCYVTGSPMELTTSVETTQELVATGDTVALRQFAVTSEGSVAWTELARLEERQGHWREALEAATRGLGVSVDARLLMLRARCLARIGDPDAARRDFDRALLVDPMEHQVCIFKAELGLDTNKLEQALADFADYIERQTGRDGNGDHWAQTINQVYINRAWAYLESKRFAEAAADARIATLAGPSDLNAWENLAEAEAGLNNPQGAFDAYTRAIELSPDRAGLYAGRAKAALALNNGPAAQADRARLATLEPDHPDLI